jgi:hypothetical protein
MTQQGRSGVLKRTTNEQRLVGPRPSDRWIKIGSMIDPKYNAQIPKMQCAQLI